MLSMNSKFVKKQFGLIKEETVSQVVKAVYVEEKRDSNSSDGKTKDSETEDSKINYTGAEKMQVISSRGKKNKKWLYLYD